MKLLTNPIIRTWKWWFTPHSTDSTVIYRERALRVLLPIFLFLRVLGTIGAYFLTANLPKPYAPQWLAVIFYVVPILLSFYFLLRQKVGWAGAFFVLHWYLVDMLSLPAEGYWYPGYQISLIIQVVLGALLLPSRAILPFCFFQIVTVGIWGNWLDVHHFDPPLLSSGQPVSVFSRAFVTLAVQETIILFIVRYLRLEMEKSLQIQQSTIDQLQTEVIERQHIETRLRGILENSPDFISEIDRNGTMLFASRRADEYVGTQPYKYLLPDSEGQIDDYIRKAYETGEQTTFEIQMREDDGSWQWYSVRIGPVKSDGKVDKLVVITTNIHTQKKAEDVQKKLISELEFKNAELERFTYTVSHELKTPLVTMKGFIGSIQKDLQDGNIKRAYDDFSRVLSSIDKMRETLQDLLELSRIGRIINPPEEVDTVRLIQDALETLDSQIRSSDVAVAVAAELPAMYGDRVRLREVFENLIGNAIKYTSDQTNPIIKIGIRKQEDEQAFFIQDNGLGVDPKYHMRIFNLFEKLNPTIEGTGVGLALVKRIVEVHGGTIWVESDGLSKGSTFCFTLPDSRRKS